MYGRKGDEFGVGRPGFRPFIFTDFVSVGKPVTLSETFITWG